MHGVTIKFIHNLVSNYNMICIYSDTQLGKDPQFYIQVNLV